MTSTRHIIHLELFTPEGPEHHYYGSLAAIYEEFSAEQLGIKLRSLYGNYNLDKGPYQNKKCRISKAPIKRKPIRRS